MTELAVLLVVLAIITVIGHVIWILCARLLGFRTLTVSAKAIAAGEVCAHCGRAAVKPRVHQPTPPPIPFAIKAPTSYVPVGASHEIESPGAPVPPQPPQPVQVPSLVPDRAPPAPHRSLSSIVSAFMEERNIRWGELVGGLLIVGCSIALVISFWAEISRLPFFRFAAMTSVTAALFGLGLYSEHRWKLPTTSRGILLISTLLTPLNFLAFAAFSGSAGELLLICEVLSIALFASLLWAAAKVIAPQWPGLLTCGTAGLSASLFGIRFLGTPIALSHMPSLLLLAALPIGCEVLICGLALARARRRRFIHGFAAESLFLLLGVMSFATILAVGLIVHDAPRWQWALQELSPLIAIGAAPLLAGGAILHHRIKRAKFVHLRVTATAVAILGALIVLSSIGLAWPDALPMLAAALSAFLILTLIASIEDLPLLHLAAVPCLALAWVLGFHLLRHDLNWESSSKQMALALSHSSNAIALIPLLCMLGLASEWMSRRGTTATSRICLGLVAALGTVGVALASWRGFGVDGDPNGAVWIYLSYGTGSLLLSNRKQREPFAWAGWLLLAAFAAQLCLTRSHLMRPWEMALLIFASVTIVADRIAFRPVTRQVLSGAPELGVTASAVASILLLGSLWPNSPTLYLLWLGAIWFVVAARESSRLLLFVAQCVVQLAVTLAYLSAVSAPAHLLKPEDFVHAIQINAMLFAGFAVWWNLIARSTIVRKRFGGLLSRLETIDIVIAVAFNALLLFPSAALLALSPISAGQALGKEIGGAMQWAALLSASVAALAVSRRGSERIRLGVISALAAMASAVVAVSIASITYNGWDGFHSLIAANLLFAWGMAAFGAWHSRFRADPAIIEPISLAQMNAPPHLATEGINVLSYSRSEKVAHSVLQDITNRWACAFAGIVVSLAIRGMAGDALRATWSITPVVMISLLFAAMASWSLRRTFLFGFGLLLNLAATLWFIANPLNLPGLSILDFANVNAIVLASAGLATLIIDLHLLRPNPRFDARSGPAFHNAAAIGALTVSTVATAAALLGTFQGRPISINFMIFTAALVSTLACVVGRMWDVTSRLRIVAIYATGLVIVAATAAEWHLAPRETIWLGSILLSCYTLVTAWLWRSRTGLIEISQRLGCDVTDSRDASLSLLADANSALAIFILVAGAWIDLTFAENSLRLGAAVAAVLQSLALGMVAPKQKTSPVRALALAMGMFGTVLCAWAGMNLEATVFDRLAVVLVVLGGWGIASSIFKSRLRIGQFWADAVRQNVLLAGALAVTALVTTLGCEIGSIIAERRLTIGTFTVATIAVSFAGAFALAIAVAIRGRTANTEVSDRTRAACVYAGELSLALLFLHLRLARPHWFGRLEPWWPLIVMGIAFASAAIGETLRRKGQEILAEPMHRTVLFLPLLPTLGFYLLPSRVDLSLLLLSVAILYGLMSLARKSTLHALLAGLAANLALWTELNRFAGAGFLDHPQIWVIPFGLLMLAAAESNRQRLGADSLRLLRYFSLSIIYLSSTADIFLNGVERAPWLPLVLAVLSIGGVLAGVSFRIKPLLFLGVWFLTVAVLTMIYYASRSLDLVCGGNCPGRDDHCGLRRL